jgi:competence protein ComEC
MALWCTAGVLVPYFKAPPPGLRCTFLSVGHGCAVVVELPGGGAMLYDAGQLGAPESSARRIAEFLWSRGITKIEQVVLSHADVDHFNALPELLRRFSVGAVYVSPVMFQGESAALEELAAAIRAAGVPIRHCWRGSVLPAGKAARITSMHPPAAGVGGSDNANSIVLMVEHARRRLLLTGDLENGGLDALLKLPPVDCDVLLAPHHGSARSNPPGIRDWSSPEWVVISGGAHANAETVETAYEARGASVRHTHEFGAITVRIEGGSVAVTHFSDAVDGDKGS